MKRKYYILGYVAGYAIVFAVCVSLYVFAGWDFWKHEPDNRWGSHIIDATPKEIFKRPGGLEAHGQIGVPVSESAHPVER